MFIRTKKINNCLYAYFVKNKWVKGKTKQTTVKYIGRVFNFNSTKDVDFMKFSKLEGKRVTNREILTALVEWELHKHGFVKEEIKRLLKRGNRVTWKKKDIVANAKTFSIKKGKKEVALAFNDGFLSKSTLQRILRFTMSSQEDAYKYAKYFVEAGIQIPQEVFVHMFKNVKRR